MFNGIHGYSGSIPISVWVDYSLSLWWQHDQFQDEMTHLRSNLLIVFVSFLVIFMLELILSFESWLKFLFTFLILFCILLLLQLISCPNESHPKMILTTQPYDNHRIANCNSLNDRLLVDHFYHWKSLITKKSLNHMSQLYIEMSIIIILSEFSLIKSHLFNLASIQN